MFILLLGCCTLKIHSFLFALVSCVCVAQLGPHLHRSKQNDPTEMDPADTHHALATQGIILVSHERILVVLTENVFRLCRTQIRLACPRRHRCAIPTCLTGTPRGAVGFCYSACRLVFSQQVHRFPSNAAKSTISSGCSGATHWSGCHVLSLHILPSSSSASLFPPDEEPMQLGHARLSWRVADASLQAAACIAVRQTTTLPTVPHGQKSSSPHADSVSLLL